MYALFVAYFCNHKDIKIGPKAIEKHLKIAPRSTGAQHL